ncbi:Ferritin [Limihaloglobus sulfuriphilus]|uniref:Ferritin n=1 Tax=Limihaloglobus sulfuriphilus TaxID=1851148 RepID=A0A1Q2MCM8_9BACT|nr:ferritin [Limihaloglobus sulfuriphilus]AQQ70451.1 Ferritin [Limihaloglobus sulfuriphilus]
MLSEKMQDAINEQINAELFSAYLYLSMSAWLADNGMPGGANWMKVQAMEEFTHADKFFNYVLERGGKIKLGAINAPQASWESASDVYNGVLEHEQKVTGLINSLMDVAVDEKDHAAKIFLQWFVEEQVEEEASAQEVIDKVKLTSANPGAMFMVDKDLGSRVFTPPESEG